MVDRSGIRTSVQVTDLRRYGVLSSIKRWAWEEMKVWTMVVAAPAVPCSFLQLVCPPGYVQSWSVIPVNSKMSSRARMLPPPPPHPTTAFRSIGAESNEWARGLSPAGLVSAGGKSGVKVTAARTVRGSTSLLLIPYIPSWPRGTPSSTTPCGPR